MLNVDEKRNTGSGGAFAASAEYPNGSFFSTREFILPFARAIGDGYEPIALEVSGSGPPRTMYGIQAPTRLQFLKRAWLAPFDLYASPGWVGHLVDSTVLDLVRSLQEMRTKSFVWNVRFDQEALANALDRLGVKSQRKPCRILPLDGGYDRISAAYGSNIRRKVRTARRCGVSVREAKTLEDIHAHYAVYMRLVELKQQHEGYHFVYPKQLFLDLFEHRAHVRFLLAEHEGAIISAGIFIRDGCSVFDFQHGSDRAFSHLCGDCAVLDAAVRWACEIKVPFFNLTDSGGVASREEFKASWGAHREYNWAFEWENPIWNPLSRLGKLVKA